MGTSLRPLVVFLLGLLQAEFIMSQQWCAELDPAHASQATGFISLNIDATTGQGQYFIELDLSNVDMSTLNPSCDLTKGLSYHVHSYWDNFASGVTSASGSDCVGANTGGHYDPTLACSGASQNLTACNRLSRFGSVYDCQYLTKPYTCEVGDLSGKFGSLPYNENLLFTSSTFLIDNYPPYPEAYLVNDLPFWTMWASVVFHCSNGNRLLCAKFQTTESTSCKFPSTTSNDDDSDGIFKKSLVKDYFIAMIITGFFTFCGLCLFVWVTRHKLCFCFGEESLISKGSNRRSDNYSL